MNGRIRYLNGTGVYLRPLEPADADWSWEVLNNDEEGRRLTGTQVPFTHAQIAAYIDRQASDDSRASFAIVRQEDDQLLGEVVLNEIYPANRRANLRIFVAQEFTGQGYGTEAIRLILDYGFGMLNLHRVELDVYTINERAIHVYEKVGFRREGVKRQNWYYNHRYYDSIVMSMLEDEFRARYSK
jgi:RimJ/RimL family protein N-acetyltransferase